MKKRNMLTVLLAAVLLVLTACGSPVAQPDSSTAQPSGISETGTPEDPAPPETTETPVEVTEPHDTIDTSTTESNILVVYFSRVGITPFGDDVDATSSASINIRDGELVGNMQYLAEFVAEETGGDLFQIITEKEYPTGYRAAIRFFRILYIVDDVTDCLS